MPFAVLSRSALISALVADAPNMRRARARRSLSVSDAPRSTPPGVMPSSSFDIRRPYLSTGRVETPSSIMPPRCFFTRGILAPAARASFSAMATACLVDLTFGPSFEPLCSLPSVNSVITRPIFCSAFLTLPPLAYFAARAGLFIGPSPPGMSARLTVMPPLANLRPEVVS